jgi:hypothetical protein
MALRLGFPGGARGARLARKAGLGEEVLGSEFETDQKAEIRESSRSEVRGFQNSRLRTSCRASFAETAWRDQGLDRASLRGM